MKATQVAGLTLCLATLCLATLCLATLGDAAPDRAAGPAAAPIRRESRSSDYANKISSRKRRPQANIIGGEIARIRDFPYQVFLLIHIGIEDSEDEAYATCGGAIISKRHILTAGHCVKRENISDIYVVAGADDPIDKPRLVFYVINRYLYNNEDIQNVRGDVAVLMVDRKIPLLALGITPLELRKDKIAEGTLCTVAGWGKSYDGGDQRLLKYVHVRVKSDRECHNSYDDNFKKDMICAAGTGFGEDVCTGDSGSPLTCGGQLVGVVAGGRGCGLLGAPGVYNDVSFYRDWILSVVARDELVLSLLAIATI